MSEPVFQIQHNGQQVITDDFNLIGQVSGLADDRVLAELFRPTLFDETNVSKGILPYAVGNQPDEDLINPGIGGGSIRVNAFRAVVGSRTSYHADTKANWRDIRSAVSVGTSAVPNTISFGAASGNPRWDLVYATVAVDANGPSVSRKIKDPATKVITGTGVTTYLQTTVTIQTVVGTPSATPVFPVAPADSGSTYYIPIAYVWIPTTYSPTYTFGTNSVVVVARCIPISTSTSAVSVEVADQQYTPGGTVVTSTRQQSWLTSPQAAYLPPTMAGRRVLQVALDLSNASVGSHSHADNSVIDSRDWRGRYCFWKVMYFAGALPFPWEDGVSATSSNIAFDGTGSYTLANVAKPMIMGSGQTIIKNFDAAIAGTSLVAGIDHTNTGLDADIAIYCDHTDGGKLKLRKTSNPHTRFFFELDFSPPMGLRTHV